MTTLSFEKTFLLKEYSLYKFSLQKSEVYKNLEIKIVKSENLLHLFALKLI